MIRAQKLYRNSKERAIIFLKFVVKIKKHTIKCALLSCLSYSSVVLTIFSVVDSKRALGCFDLAKLKLYTQMTTPHCAPFRHLAGYHSLLQKARKCDGLQLADWAAQ